MKYLPLKGADPRVRRTRRLRANLRDIALADGGEAGSRLAGQLGMRASPSYLLRLIRQSNATSVPTPRVVGVDEWAKRKGRYYGAILVDLEECDLKLRSGHCCGLKLDSDLAARGMRSGQWRGFAVNDWTEEQRARFALD